MLVSSMAGLWRGGFVAPAMKDFWPKPGSVLIGRADASFTPELDFNHIARDALCDVGACESDGRVENPGWQVRPGFKNNHRMQPPEGLRRSDAQ